MSTRKNIPTCPQRCMACLAGSKTESHPTGINQLILNGLLLFEKNFHYPMEHFWRELKQHLTYNAVFNPRDLVNLRIILNFPADIAKNFLVIYCHTDEIYFCSTGNTLLPIQCGPSLVSAKFGDGSSLCDTQSRRKCTK